MSPEASHYVSADLSRRHSICRQFEARQSDQCTLLCSAWEADNVTTAQLYKAASNEYLASLSQAQDEQKDLSAQTAS